MSSSGPEFEPALDEYHNIRRPRNPDKTIDDMKHWFPLLLEEVYHSPPPALREALDEPIVYAVIRGVRAISYVAAGPLDVVPPQNIVQATFGVIWVSTLRRRAPKAATAVLAGAIEGAGGRLASNARFAYLASTGRVTIIERLPASGVYAKLREAAKRVAATLKRYALDDRLLQKLFEVLQSLDAYENVPIEEVAAVDPEAALALPLAKLLHKEMQRLSEEAVKAKDVSDVEQQIVELYRRGVSPREIAERFGVAVGTIYNVIRRYGLQPRKPHRVRRVTPEEEQRIVELYKQGHSIYSIAKMLGRAVSTVYMVLKRNGLV